MKALVRYINRAGISILQGRNDTLTFILFLIGSLPIVLASLFGLLSNVVDDTCTPSAVFVGYGNRLNWIQFAIAVPITLLFVRAIYKATFGGTMPLQFKRIFEATHESLAGNFFFVPAGIIFSVFVSMLDLREVLYWYIHSEQYSCQQMPRELDWTVAFLASSAKVSIMQNALLMFFAYLAQAWVLFMGWILFFLLISFDYTYIRSVFLRSRGRANINPHIVIDFFDPLKKFGLEPLNEAFNWHVALVCLMTPFLLLSRFANQKQENEDAFFNTYNATPIGSYIENVNNIYTKLIELFYIPDFGQFIIITIYVILSFICFLPSVVKHLPFRNANVLRSRDVRVYLWEFIPPTNQKYGRVLDEDKIKTLCACVKDSSFWPAGDAMARVLMTIVWATGIAIVFPLTPSANAIMASTVYVSGIVVIASAATALSLKAFSFPLRLIDKRLVE